MDIIFPVPKLFIAIPVLVVLLCCVIYWQQRWLRDRGAALYDRATVWLLIGLLIIAAISIGLFMLTLLNVTVHIVYLNT